MKTQKDIRPADAIEITTECAYTKLKKIKQGEPIEKAFESRTQHPCLIAASVSDGWLGITVRGPNVRLEFRIEDIFGTVMMAAEAAEMNGMVPASGTPAS